MKTKESLNMHQNILNQLANRKSLKLKSQLKATKPSDKVGKQVVVTSSNDLGVCRNGGRLGARYAPQAILAQWGQFHNTHKLANLPVIEITKSESFESMQMTSIQNWDMILKSIPNQIVHLGGGHDHIYPLLQALGKVHQKISVINIDAHCDTRKDELSHSGTPFRQFDKEFKGDFHLYQIGIHQFANDEGTLSPLKNGTMKICFDYEVDSLNLPEFIDQQADKDRLWLLSLDCDALSSQEMVAVSAVNPDGLCSKEIHKILDYYCKNLSGTKCLGIYEYNPVYDDLSCRGAKLVANLIDVFFRS